MKIYTRTGDKGKTSLFTGQRVDKSNPVIAAIGAADECNSCLGLAISHLPQGDGLSPLREQLETIQHALFDVGAALATPLSQAGEKKAEKVRFDSDEIACLESWIDAMEKELPELKAFILPGGHPAGAALHLSRSICRRAETLALPLHLQGDLSPNVLIFLNRLSDYLFMASRFANLKLSRPETLWQQHKIKLNS